MVKLRSKEFFTITEAAKILGVNPITLRRWDKTRKLVARRHPINNYRLYPKKRIDTFINKILES